MNVVEPQQSPKSPEHWNDTVVKIRQSIANMVFMAYLRGDAHVVSCIGTIEILVNLFNNGFDFTNDVLLISKGHAALALYSVLFENGKISREEFLSFRTEYSEFGIHVSGKLGNLSRLSSGSLGHGIGFGSGIALSRKKTSEKGKIFVVVGDGELNEGSNYEALQIAVTNKLNNLVILVDHNKVQSVGCYSEISGETSLVKKFQSFGFVAKDISNNMSFKNHFAVGVNERNSPIALIYDSSANSSLPNLQGKILWHYRRPNREDLLEVLELLNIDESVIRERLGLA